MRPLWADPQARKSASWRVFRPCLCNRRQTPGRPRWPSYESKCSKDLRTVDRRTLRGPSMLPQAFSLAHRLPQMEACAVQSLREKLLKAGLVTEEQARETARETSPPAVSAPAPSPPAPGSKAFQRKESLRQLELDRTVRQWVHASQVPVETGERAFFFMTRKGKLRRWDLSEHQAQLLYAGQFDIFGGPDPGGIEHSLVPAETAEKIVALCTKSDPFYNRKGSPICFHSGVTATRR